MMNAVDETILSLRTILFLAEAEQRILAEHYRGEFERDRQAARLIANFRRLKWEFDFIDGKMKKLRLE